MNPNNIIDLSNLEDTNPDSSVFKVPTLDDINNYNCVIGNSIQKIKSYKIGPDNCKIQLCLDNPKKSFCCDRDIIITVDENSYTLLQMKELSNNEFEQIYDKFFCRFKSVAEDSGYSGGILGIINTIERIVLDRKMEAMKKELETLKLKLS